jgi:DNA polymerase-3 subunit gamma/tau
VLATTEAQKVLPTVVDRCHRFDFGRPSAEQVARVLERVATQEQIPVQPGALALVARHATGSFRDALGTLEQLVTYAGGRAIEPEDVLAVLGVADAELLFAAVDAVIARDPAQALRTVARLAESGRDPGQVLRDLEVHGRELLTVQVLGEVPPEIRVTPERDRRLAEQAAALGDTDAVRLLDLVAAALEATSNGAQARIQLELLLAKAAAPEVDPSVAALLARIERLERERATGGATATSPSTSASILPGPPAPAPAPSPGPVPGPDPAPPAAPDTPPVPSPEPPPPGPAPEPPTPGPDPGPPAPPGPGPAPEPPTPRPEPAPGPAIAAPDTAEPISAARLQSDDVLAAWPAVVDVIRAENPMLAALLADARPVELSARELTVAFPAGAEFLKRKAENDGHRRIAAEAIRTATGRELAPRYILLEPVEIAAAAPTSPETAAAPASAPAANGATGVPASAGVTTHRLPAPVLSGEELVQRFLEEFDAEEILDDPAEA